MKTFGTSIFFLALFVAGCATAPVETPSVADSAFLDQYAETYRFRLGNPRSYQLTPDEQHVLFLRTPPRSKVGNLFEYNIATGNERTLLTARQILAGAAEHLSPEERARRERMRQTVRGIAGYRLSKDGNQILLSLSGRLYLTDRRSGDVLEIKGSKGYPIDARFSPTARHIACVRKNDLYVTDVATRTEVRLTKSTSPHVSYGAAEFVGQEEMGRYHGYWWSPDGQRIAYQKTDTSGVETLRILDPTYPERPVNKQAYPRPGKKNAEVQLAISSLDGNNRVWVAWDRKKYPYLATVRWQKNAPLTLVVQNREQTEHVVLAAETQSGMTRVLHTEKDAAWINLDQSVPRWVDNGTKFIWSTERNGTAQLELRSVHGKFIRALTPASLTYNRLLSVDEKRGEIYVSASSSPTQRHIYRVSLNTGKSKRISEHAGVHSAVYSKTHNTWIHTASYKDGNRRWAVRNYQGKVVGNLLSRAENPPFKPNVEFLKAGEKNEFHSLIIRPRNFDPDIKYPVIVYVYGGPHHRVVSEQPNRYLIQQWIADHGFVVVMSDGRGTPGQGRDWERAIKHDVAAPALADQVQALRWLGNKYPELDMDRVGVYGWSFGGYMTAMMVMRHPELYKVGVSGAPVADWHDYDTHYTERYMGLPQKNARGYKEASVLTWAKQLIRPLLIIHGTVDDNVYFMHALKMSKALFDAGRPHNVLPLSGSTHMVASKHGVKNLYNRIVGFFSAHLKSH